jgi:hypothetical protein
MQNSRQFLTGHMEQRRICKNAVKAAFGQLHCQKILMENLALRIRARHDDELLRSVEAHGFVPQRSEMTEIAAGSTTEIEDGIRRVALYRIEECRVVLADIVVSRAVPESPGEPIVIRDRRVREALTPTLPRKRTQARRASYFATSCRARCSRTRTRPEWSQPLPPRAAAALNSSWVVAVLGRDRLSERAPWRARFKSF